MQKTTEWQLQKMTSVVNFRTDPNDPDKTQKSIQYSADIYREGQQLTLVDGFIAGAVTPYALFVDPGPGGENLSLGVLGAPIENDDGSISQYPIPWRCVADEISPLPAKTNIWVQVQRWEAYSRWTEDTDIYGETT